MLFERRRHHAGDPAAGCRNSHPTSATYRYWLRRMCHRRSRRKKISASIVAGPFNALGEIKAGAKMLRFTGDVWKGHPCCVGGVARGRRHGSRPRGLDAGDSQRHRRRAALHGRGTARANARMLSKDGKNYPPFEVEVIDRAMNFYDPPSTRIRRRSSIWNGSRVASISRPGPIRRPPKLSWKSSRKLSSPATRTFMDDLSADFVVKDLVNYDFIRKAFSR